MGSKGRAWDHSCGLDQGEFVGSKKTNPMDEVHWVWGFWDESLVFYKPKRDLSALKFCKISSGYKHLL
jgi:hypothetical protein